jgi:hypothetical protein
MTKSFVYFYIYIFFFRLRGHEGFTLSDLLYHFHRIYVYGTNRYDNRWYLSSEPPEEIEYLVDTALYKKFVSHFNKIARWNKFQSVMLRILSVLYFPLYWFLLEKARKKKYKRLMELISMSQMVFIFL